MIDATTTAPIETGRLNLLAVASVLLASLTLASLWLTGTAAFALFGVGAGHVALNQIRARGERGRMLAIVGLASNYVIGAYLLTLTLRYSLVLIQQLVL